jgi:predicted esterase
MFPHQGQSVVTVGPGAASSRAAMVMIHGRNAAPRNILDLAAALPHPNFTYVAPAAAGGSWYPHSFMADQASNEPGLSSGLSVIEQLIGSIVQDGVPERRIILLGFSQGACLTCEFAVRHARRYGAVLAFSGGVIGPPGTTWNYPGTFAGTPVFLGCSDVDGHVPRTRVDESAAVFERMGAEVTERIYRGMGHVVNDDELAWARAIMVMVAAAS